jgi:hypothetical protein
VLAVLSLVGLGRLAQDRRDLVFELGQGAVGPIGGIGGHLGAVQGDDPDANQPRCRAQLQRLDQEPAQGNLMTDTEAGNRHVVWELVAGKHSEGDILVAAPLDLPRGAHPDGVGVQQHPEQGPGVVGGMAVPIGPVSAQERTEVQLVDDVEDEPGQVIVGQPVAQVGGQQERLVGVAAQEVVGHGASYPFALLAPNALVLKCQFLRLAMRRLVVRLMLALAGRESGNPSGNPVVVTAPATIGLDG